MNESLLVTHAPKISTWKLKKTLIFQGTDGIYQFLSGVPVYPNTRFLRLKAESVLADYKKTAHFFLYASAAYGWPFFVYENIVSGCCKLMPYFR